MKILVLTTTFPRWTDDVVPSFVYHLARMLCENGLETIVLAPHYPGAKKFEVMEGIKVYRFAYFKPERYERLAYGPGIMPNFKRSLLAKIQLPLLFLSELFHAMLIIRREKVDVINSHWLLPSGLVGIICKSIFKIPNIVVVHGSDVNVSKKSGLLLKVCYRILDSSDVVTVNSNYIKNTVLSINRYIMDKVSYIPMGVDGSVYMPKSTSRIKDRYGAQYLVFSVGRLIDWKGLKYLIMAMREVVIKAPGAKLVIGGSGPEKAGLEKLALDLGLQGSVIFPGYIDAMTLSDYYSAADVFVLPSIDLNGQTEALGVVLIEAMASGIPVIGSNVGGIPDIIKDGDNGFLVPEKSPDDLSERIIRLLLDRELATRLATNGLKTVNDRFLWKDIGKSFSDVNKRLVQGKHERPVP